MDGLLRVGASTAPITPDPGRPMAGYASRASPAQGVLDDLCCRVVVFSQDDVVLVLVTLDLVYVPAALASAIRRDIAAALGTEPQNVMVSATHTHCGPAIGTAPENNDLHRAITRTASGVAREAHQRLEGTRLLRTMFGLAGLVHNRRDPTAPLDQTGTVLLAVTGWGTVVASIVNVACHPTVLEGETAAYSRDFPGVVCDTVEQICGGHALFLQGFAGDVNPLFHDHSVDDMRLFGRQIGVKASDAVLSALRSAVPNWTVNLSMNDVLPVEGSQAYPTIEVSHLDASLVAVDVEAKPPMSGDKIREAFVEARAEVEQAHTPAERQLATARAQQWWIEDLMTTRPGCLGVDYPAAGISALPVQVFAIGDRFRIIALPGEPLTASAKQIRGELGDDVLLVGYANQAASYLPTRKDFAQQGYEVGSTRYVPGTAEKLTETVLTLSVPASPDTDAEPPRV